MAKSKYTLASGYRIKKRSWAVGGEPRHAYVLMLGLDEKGKHVRRQFPTLEAAKREAARVSVEVAQHGIAAHRLDDKMRIDAFEALQVLNGTATLKQAAEEYMDRHKPVGDAVGLSDLRDEYLAAIANGTHRPKGKKRRKLSDLSRRDAARATERLVDSLGPDVPVLAVSTDELDLWIAGQGVGPVTQANLKRRLQGFFEYAVTMKYLTDNPVVRVSVDDATPELPTFWKPDQVEAVLVATEAECPRLVPYMALAFFAGLRPYGELPELTWEDIDLDAELITIPASIAKSGARPVAIERNLKAWLERYCPQNATGKVYPLSYVTLRRDRAAIAKSCGIGSWPPDITRHSYCTYHLARYQDISRTMRFMGHSTVKMIRDHYDGLANKKQAEKYFAIRPKKSAEGKLVSMHSPASV